MKLEVNKELGEGAYALVSQGMGRLLRVGRGIDALQWELRECRVDVNSQTFKALQSAMDDVFFELSGKILGHLEAVHERSKKAS